MLLEKAIEILSINNDHNPNFTDTEKREAHQLSIEALQRILELRRAMIMSATFPLLTEAHPLPPP